MHLNARMITTLQFFSSKTRMVIAIYTSDVGPSWQVACTMLEHNTLHYTLHISVISCVNCCGNSQG